MVLHHAQNTIFRSTSFFIKFSQLCSNDVLFVNITLVNITDKQIETPLKTSNNHRLVIGLSIYGMYSYITTKT